MGLTKPRASQIFDIDYKQATRVITVSNVTLSGGAPSVVDGVSLVAGDRVLVTGQTTGSQNGLYAVSSVGVGSDGTWARTSDGNEDGEIQAGMIVMVTEGATYADTQWKLTTDNPIDIGTTALTFETNNGGGGSSYTNANVATYLSSGTVSTDILTTAAISATGNVTGANIITLGIVSATGNITGGNVLTTGDITVTGDVTAANFNTTSDARIKTNVRQIENAMDIVNQLNGVFFDKNGVPDLGLIAQQVEAVLPVATKTLDDDMQTKTVNYGGLVGLLIEAIKDNKKEIEELKIHINRLTS